jgi:UDP-glucose 4-epimerase
MTVLVTGAAGLLGQSAMRLLTSAGVDCLAFDVVKPRQLSDHSVFELGSTVDSLGIEQVFSRYRITPVLHLAVGAPSNP